MESNTKAFVFSIVYAIVLYLFNKFLGYTSQDCVEFTIGTIFVLIVNIFFRIEELKK